MRYLCYKTLGLFHQQLFHPYLNIFTRPYLEPIFIKNNLNPIFIEDRLSYIFANKIDGLLQDSEA